MALVGKSLDPRVIRQFEVRRRHLQKGAYTERELQYNHGRTAWVRLMSAVKISDSISLAKTHILRGGEKLSGLDLTDLDNSSYVQDDIRGIIPRPGIESVSTKDDGAWGMYRRATIKFKVFSRDQLDLYDKLYMRPGFTLLLEFGNTIYLTNNEALSSEVYAVTEKEFFEDAFPNLERAFDIEADENGNVVIDRDRSVLWHFRQRLGANEIASDFNYTGMIGQIFNFEYDINTDGSYSCTTQIIGPGLYLEGFGLGFHHRDEIGVAQEIKIEGNVRTVLKSQEVGPSDLERGVEVSQELIDAYKKLKNVGSLTAEESLLIGNLTPEQLDFLENLEIKREGGLKSIHYQAIDSIAGGRSLTKDQQEAMDELSREELGILYSLSQLAIQRLQELQKRGIEFDILKKIDEQRKVQNYLNLLSGSPIDNTASLPDTQDLAIESTEKPIDAIPTSILANQQFDLSKQQLTLERDPVVSTSPLAHVFELILNYDRYEEPTLFQDHAAGIIALLNREAKAKSFRTPLDEDQDKFIYGGKRNIGDQRPGPALPDQAEVYIKFSTFLKFINSLSIPVLDKQGNPLLTFAYDVNDREYDFTDSFGFGVYATYSGHFSHRPDQFLLPKVPGNPVGEPIDFPGDPARKIVGEDLYPPEVNSSSFLTTVPKSNRLILNIWVNVGYLLSEISEGNMSIAEYVKTILEDLNVSLGQINDFFIFIDEDQEKAHILDNKVWGQGIIDLDTSILRLPLSGLGGTVTDLKMTSKVPSALTTLSAAVASQGGRSQAYTEPMYKNINQSWFNYSYDLSDNIMGEVKIEQLEGSEESDTEAQETDRQTVVNFYQKMAEAILIFRSGSVVESTFSYLNESHESVANSHLFDLDKILEQADRAESAVKGGVLPFTLEATFDGISGVSKTQYFAVEPGLLPKITEERCVFGIVGFEHEVSANRWTTKVSAVTVVLPDADRRKFLEDRAKENSSRHEAQQAEIEAANNVGLLPADQPARQAPAAADTGSFSFRDNLQAVQDGQVLDNITQAQVNDPNGPYRMLAPNGATVRNRREYLVAFASIAVQQRIEYGVPASIKIAQAFIESGLGSGAFPYGTTLAVIHKNHFGIKCHAYWVKRDGPRVYRKDDDTDAAGNLIDSCFRVYNTVYDSFVDHSLFLKVQNMRYKDLFKLKVTDYKGWAFGLRYAGYFTNVEAANLIVSVVESSSNPLAWLDTINLNDLVSELDRRGYSKELERFGNVEQ